MRKAFGAGNTAKVGLFTPATGSVTTGFAAIVTNQISSSFRMHKFQDALIDWVASDNPSLRVIKSLNFQRITERCVRLMMIAAPHLPKNLWSYATKYTAELMNHCPSTVLPDDKTPQQLLLAFPKTPNPVPSVYGIRKFGQPGWAHIPEQRRIGRDGSQIFYM
jgi:hypothetical protein